MMRIAYLMLSAMICCMLPQQLQAKDFYVWKDTTLATPKEDFLIAGGKRKTLADLKGKVVLINFWATWCPPCIKELPTLAKLEQEEANAGLVVLPLSMDSAEFSVLENFIAQKGLRFPHLAQDDTGKLFAQLKSRGLPLTYLMDAQGTLRGVYEGATDWTLPEHRKKIRAFLAEAKARNKSK